MSVPLAASPFLVSFVAGDAGPWRIEHMAAWSGPDLPLASRLTMIERSAPVPGKSAWVLRGTTSYPRYTRRDELDRLLAVQAGLGRAEATRAALIPMRKSAAWWALAQDERRAIMEEQSRHIGIGMEYLPAISRRLMHGRELGEPFDFLTWFEYAPAHAQAFEDLVGRLRETPEWRYVEHEVDVRLVRD